MKKILLFLSFLLMSIYVNAGSETFTFGTNPSAYTSGSSQFSQGIVEFLGTKGTGSTATRAWSDGLRSYAGSTAQFSVPSGYVITSITGYDPFNFSGEQQTVLFTGLSKTTCKSNVIVTYKSDIPCDSVTISLTPPINGIASLSNTKVCPPEDITVTYTPDEGYMLDKILANDDEVENPITITEATTILVLFKEIPPEPSVDIIEWNPDYIKVDIDNLGDNVTAIIENQNTLATIEEKVATELFFSKYFEGEGNIKMFAIFNGTARNICLKDYTILIYLFNNEDNIHDDSNSSHNYEIAFTSADTIYSKQEIIFYSTDNTVEALQTCSNPFFADIELNHSGVTDKPRWIKNDDIRTKISGNDAIFLKKNGTSVDIFGSTKAPEGKNCRGGKEWSWSGSILNMDFKKTSSDFSDEVWDNQSTYGINITDSLINIHTARCVLYRNNTVLNGDSAVTYNNSANGFYTLTPKEWNGRNICSTGVVSGAGTCNSYSDLGTFDYGTYYAQYVALDTVSLNNTIYDSETGLYTISIPLLDTLSCTNLKVVVSDGETTLEKTYLIPIFVQDNITTTHTIFTKEGSDCATCDVVVLANKTLTSAGTSSRNRDVKLYPGAKLNIPNSTTYTINSLALRRDNNLVSTLGLAGTLNTNHLYFDLYIDYKDWYYVALPDEFNISNLRFANGKSATQREDYWIKYYDGKHRAETQSGSWKSAANDTTFMPGCGFIIGIPDNYIKKELRFEFDANRTLTNEKSNKTSGNVTAWGITNTSLTPNHKGWNLVGNPYMNTYNTDFASVIRAGELIKDETSGQWNGHWLVSDTTTSKLRYAVIPSKDPEDAAAGGYKSVVLDEKPLDPFTCFFVQMGGANENPQTLKFKVSQRRNNIVARNYQEQEDEELFLRIKIGNKKTGCFISNKFTDAYEPGDDLESRYPIYLSINGFKLLYSAVNDSIIENGILVTSDGGNITIDPKVDVNKFEQINVFYNNKWYSLLYGETVDVEAGDFLLQAIRKQLDVPTDIDNVKPSEGLYKFTDGKHIYINQNGYIYNILGTKIK